MTGLENPWPRLPKWLKKFARILSHKHDEMSSFCLNNGFRLQKIKTRQKKPKTNNQGHHQTLETASEKALLSYHVSQGFPRSAILNEEKALGTTL